MDSEQSYFAAEDVKAINLVTVNLQSSNHDTKDIPPCSNINKRISFSHTLAAKFKQQRKQRLACSSDKETKALDDKLGQLAKILSNFKDRPDMPPNARKTVTTLHTHYKESTHLLS